MREGEMCLVAVAIGEMARPRAASGSYRRSVRVREGRELPGDEGDRRGHVLMDTRTTIRGTGRGR